ncbi:hypothetical protein [Selenomonas massiliensis]|mgnify:CR=1 FL=1|uniref:hypothetical protein n=1 Tax=Selenomonas massiliensis TaxID=2058293 RepID=UPI000D10D6F9|nr:hypothetical protein [Selenomonas massiliensis]
MARNDERGSISAVGLCVLTAVLLLGLSAAQLVRSGGSVAAEYEREMQLRLAAESGVETAAARIEQSADAFGSLPKPDVYKNVDREAGVDMIPVGEDIELHVFVHTPREEEPPKDTIELVAVAYDSIEEGSPRVSDGEPWMRAKTVRARMQKKGDRYVWRRWF